MEKLTEFCKQLTFKEIDEIFVYCQVPHIEEIYDQRENHVDDLIKNPIRNYMNENDFISKDFRLDIFSIRLNRLTIGCNDYYIKIDKKGAELQCVTYHNCFEMFKELNCYVFDKDKIYDKNGKCTYLDVDFLSNSVIKKEDFEMIKWVHTHWKRIFCDFEYYSNLYVHHFCDRVENAIYTMAMIWASGQSFQHIHRDVMLIVSRMIWSSRFNNEMWKHCNVDNDMEF